jgi:hypothetical protein
VTYYNCPNEDCHEIVKEELVMISDDMNHDSSAVKAFVRKAEDHLKETRNINMEHVVQFSDGCASQYKCKFAFYDVSESEKNFHHSTERSFFGSRHGKGPCDACIGVVKSNIRNAVVRREVTVQSAEDAFDYFTRKMTKDGKEGQCNHSKRTFFLVPKNKIQHRKRSDLLTVVGTRSLHCVHSGSAEAVWTRNLSCYCDFCKGYDIGLCCESISHVDTWKFVPLTQKKKSNIQYTSERQLRIKAVIQKKTSSVESETTSEPQLKMRRVDDEVTEKTRRVDDDVTEKTETTRKEFFKNCSEYLNQANCFDDLQAKSLDLEDKLRAYSFEANGGVSILRNHLTVDKVAMALYPDNCTTRYPVVVQGDGNCLPRSISVACFGCEDYHMEVRVRIVVEMCCHVGLYTDNAYLTRGLTEQENLLSLYTQFSNHYVAGDRITDTVSRRIFEAEAMAVAKPKEYMGIWQLFAVASVLGCKLVSKYPNLGSQILKTGLHREILPRDMLEESTITIMWSSTRNDMNYRNWIPNHFVAELPLDDMTPSPQPDPVIEKHDQTFEMSPVIP